MGKLFRILGIAAMIAVIGFSFTACGGGAGGLPGEYGLRWIAFNTSYTEVQSNIISHGWAIVDSGSNWALTTGNDASAVYSFCNGLDSMDRGSFGGTFEECVTQSNEGIEAPYDLKMALRNNESNAPLAGIFNAGIAGIMFYISKN